jgi:hypothetical protein
MDRISPGIPPSGSGPLVIRLDGPATSALLRGEAVQAIADNPHFGGWVAKRSNERTNGLPIWSANTRTARRNGRRWRQAAASAGGFRSASRQRSFRPRGEFYEARKGGHEPLYPCGPYESNPKFSSDPTRASPDGC